MLTDVTWSFCPPGTPKLNVPENVFTSRNWFITEPFWPSIGEDRASSRPWSNGSVPAGVTGAAAVFSDDAWINGVKISQGLPFSPCGAVQGSEGVALTWVDPFSPGFLDPVPGSDNLVWTGVDATADVFLRVDLAPFETAGLPYGVSLVTVEDSAMPDPVNVFTLQSLSAANVGLWKLPDSNPDFPGMAITLTT